MSITLNQLVPDFQGQATSDLIFSMEQMRGYPVVLFFYPKDNTPGCTLEALAFREHYEAFQAKQVVLVGISRDTIKAHENFKKKFALPFELISDTDEKICTLFDVIKNKKMYGKEVRSIERSTFLIDAQGILRYLWRGIKVEGHVKQILDAVQGISI
jgi:peroxiredoxin Q/BCP